MKLYDAHRAPNPRRVSIFLAEKQLDVPRVQVNLGRGEHKTPEFLEKNPSGKIPVLELDDGRCIAESVAICRYLEATHPEPNLMGRDAFELGRIEMANRQCELEFGVAMGNSWVNGPMIIKIFGPREQLAPVRERADAQMHSFCRRLDRQLSKQAFVAGERFTIADITALCLIDFAIAMCALKPDVSLTHFASWHERVSARPSAKA